MSVSMQKSYVVAIVIIILLIAISGVVFYAYTSPTGFFARQNTDFHTAIQETTATYTDLNGIPVNLEQFEGTTLVVNMWASWSPFSQSDFQVLSKLKETYGDSIHIVGMNRMESKEIARAYLDYIGTPVGIQFVLDETDYFFKNFDGYAMPETVVFNTIGNSTYHMRGSLNYEEISAHIQSLTQVQE